MNKVLITILAFLALAVNRSCESDEIDNNIPANTLNDLWNLTSIQGGFADVNYQFEEGEITWEFNEQDNTLNVVNNNASDEGYDGLETGEYSFSIIQFDDILLLEINNDSYGSYYVENNELIIDQNGATSGNSDGFILDFVR